MAEADVAVPTAHSLSKSMLLVSQDENKSSESEKSVSFPRFLQLPLELQIYIWTYALEAPRVEPRVVRVTYNEKIDSFSYSFTIPPLLEVCQVSHKIAQPFYPSLLPGSAFPIYINPSIDFLHCRSRRVRVNTSMFPSSRAISILPFIDPTANVANIRNLVLDDNYWKIRYCAYMCFQTVSFSIEEMRRFRNIDELFIVGISLEQWVAIRKCQPQFESADGRRLKDRLYAAEVAKRKALPNSVVPGFCVDSEDSEAKRCRRRELKQCFGAETLPTGVIGQNAHLIYNAAFFSSVNDEVDKTYWSKMPKLTALSPSLI
jgi:hypothetical protein